MVDAGKKFEVAGIEDQIIRVITRCCNDLRKNPCLQLQPGSQIKIDGKIA
jgi:hypothetical protein